MGKKTADRIRRTKKRANQLFTDPSTALGDLEKHIQKTVGRQVKTTQKNIQKTGEAVRAGFTTLVTSAGNLIKYRKKEIGAATAGIAVGMTVAEAMRREYPKLAEHYVEEETETQKELFDDFILRGGYKPPELSEDEWIAFVGLISSKLERQLRLRLQLPVEKKYQMFELIDQATNEDCVQRDDCNKLHRFRMERNPILHGQKSEVDKYDIVVWTAKFVQNLTEETIAEYHVPLSQ